MGSLGSIILATMHALQVLSKGGRGILNFSPFSMSNSCPCPGSSLQAPSPPRVVGLELVHRLASSPASAPQSTTLVTSPPPGLSPKAPMDRDSVASLVGSKLKRRRFPAQVVRKRQILLRYYRAPLPVLCEPCERLACHAQLAALICPRRTVDATPVRREQIMGQSHPHAGLLVARVHVASQSVKLFSVYRCTTVLHYDDGWQ